MTMLPEWSIGNCVRNSILNNLKNSILHNPQTVTESANHILIWDMDIQCYNVIAERKPDSVIVNKMEKTALIIDVAIPGNKRIVSESQKRDSETLEP